MLFCLSSGLNSAQCSYTEESAFPKREEQIDAAKSAAGAWELRSQAVQRLGERERISKMFSLGVLVIPAFYTPSFLSVELFRIFTDVEAELGQLIS